jgi:hypothetical protein
VAEGEAQARAALPEADLLAAVQLLRADLAAQVEEARAERLADPAAVAVRIRLSIPRMAKFPTRSLLVRNPTI